MSASVRDSSPKKWSFCH